MALVKDLTKQVIGKRIRIQSERAEILSTVREISFGGRDTSITLEAPTSNVNFVVHVEDDEEVEVLDD